MTPAGMTRPGCRPSADPAGPLGRRRRKPSRYPHGRVRLPIGARIATTTTSFGAISRCHVAANYDGSELSIGIIADARPIPIYLNGVDVGTRYDDSFLRGLIGSRLHRGRNVIAIEANGSPGRFMRCAGDARDRRFRRQHGTGPGCARRHAHRPVRGDRHGNEPAARSERGGRSGGPAPCTADKVRHTRPALPPGRVGDFDNSHG